jgi:hypothetical protein
LAIPNICTRRVGDTKRAAGKLAKCGRRAVAL